MDKTLDPTTQEDNRIAPITIDRKELTKSARPAPGLWLVPPMSQTSKDNMFRC